MILTDVLLGSTISYSRSALHQQPSCDVLTVSGACEGEKKKKKASNCLWGNSREITAPLEAVITTSRECHILNSISQATEQLIHVHITGQMGSFCPSVGNLSYSCACVYLCSVHDSVMWTWRSRCEWVSDERILTVSQVKWNWVITWKTNTLSLGSGLLSTSSLLLLLHVGPALRCGRTPSPS